MNMDNAISPDNDHSHHKSGSAAVAFFVYLAFIFAIFIVIICSLEFCGGCRPVVPIPETDDDASPWAAEDSADGDVAPIQVVIQRDALPHCTFHQLMDAAAASTCTICLADYKAGEAVRVMPECCHVFHRSCIDRWLRIHATCPACRNPMLPPPPMQ